MTDRISHYTVFNRVTGRTTTYKSGVRASRAADRADMAYGAICCTRQAHWTKEQPDDAATDCAVADLEERGFRIGPAGILAEHVRELASMGLAI